MKPITIIVGGQYGSEGKGAVTAQVCIDEQADICARTGGPNSGHTVYYKGDKFCMQQLPVGWVRPDTELVIGAGALVNIDILVKEIALASDATGRNIWERLWIDYRAYEHVSMHTHHPHTQQRVERIGGTGKGCAAAIIERTARLGDSRELLGSKFHYQQQRIVDTEELLNDRINKGAQVVIEGTQGTLLDLFLTDCYPYATHRQTGPAQWMMELGLSPALPTNILMVLRTFPIRVAGNSGPMPQEVDWVQLAHIINQKVGVDSPKHISNFSLGRFEDAVNELIDRSDRSDREDIGDRDLQTRAFVGLSSEDQYELGRLFEFTTVTKKLRRIAHIDEYQTRRAARQVRPHRIALTFCDYMFPNGPEASTEGFIKLIEGWCNSSVCYTGWGPHDLRPTDDGGL